MATRAGVRNYKSRLESMRRRVQSMKKQTEKAVGIVVHSVEVGGSAFFFGALQGRKGSIEVLNAPIELWAAGGLHLAGFLLDNKSTSPHLHGLGDGALGAYMTTLGRSVGHKMAQKSKAGSAGLPGNSWSELPSGGTTLSESDRAVMEALNAIP